MFVNKCSHYHNPEFPWWQKPRPCLVDPKKPKTFQDFPSHRIFKHMHGALNIDKNKN
jgi:hypothetical protein